MFAQVKYSKYHALGNDYLVISPENLAFELTPEKIQRICHRNFGIGSDGILFGPLPAKNAKFGLRIFNPDGSEAEKSGNGLRIFCRYLWDNQIVQEEEFEIDTLGGRVQGRVTESGRSVRVEMGRVSFQSEKIPVTGDSREVLQESITVADQIFSFCAATIGNPHCVIQLPEVTPEIAKQYGSLLEIHPYFPNRTNVQFMKVKDRQNIQIEIWERGAGYTLASGSSSSAAAAVAHKLNLCDSEITVHMPGGQIAIAISDDFTVTMTGSVTKVAEGLMSLEVFEY
ncbi:diaminopimelate epimerase [Nostoc linckia z18]|uniref:Diaminopimelate epimerase n=2 Tax=Nostoc linckia TaxID=92942 RepID=A0A9Q5ZCW3_NOSLI|nr:diaminopimelate epimerase [Nostoc linckia]PHK39139.1 diaminopimelate epimerase [Nostoc linckia z15]PHK45592.1 diaminopimelate epimerase [Nostoc linckia z16]PHJ64593.1 diaminopimelate epimerase [Nostoc linckia z1]PHJ69944.1 diaminopimelate epimerase [Nostoc linckia z3]PHJ73019.1 diaminopimelate epimerase [Nostoc linckia z2]